MASFSNRCFIYIENLLFSVAIFIHYLSQIFWITCCSFYNSTCCFTSHFYIMEMLLSLNFMNQPLLASNFFCSFLNSLSLHRIEESQDLALDQALAQGNIVAGLIFYPDHWNVLHISNKATSISYSRVHWSSTFNFLQELFLCIHNLAVWHKRPSFWPISAFDMPSSLSLIISSFRFKMRAV